MSISKIPLYIFIASLLIACNNKSSNRMENTPENGDLNKSFVESESSPKRKAELTPEQKYEQAKEKLISEGWQEKEIPNGQFPSCYNFTPKTSSVKNYLEVYVGSGTDIAIKIMDSNSDKCVRYVFINSGSTYTIKNIPEGEYYLKIAYGKNWLSKVENEQCVGKFLRNPMYEKGKDIMNFNIQHLPDGYNIPSFKLELDVVSSGISNSFNSQNISENEFNL